MGSDPVALFSSCIIDLGVFTWGIVFLIRVQAETSDKVSVGFCLVHHLPRALHCTIPVDAHYEVRLYPKVPVSCISSLVYPLDQVIEG